MILRIVLFVFIRKNGLPGRLYALRRVFGGGDLPGSAVYGHCKEQYQIRRYHLKRNFRHRAYYQLVQRQRHESCQ